MVKPGCGREESGGKCDRTQGTKLESLASPGHWDSPLRALSLEIGCCFPLGVGGGQAPLTQGSCELRPGTRGNSQSPSALAVS